MSFYSFILLLLKITSVSDDKMLRELLIRDDILDILGEVGYTGVPHRETLETVNSIIQ